MEILNPITNPAALDVDGNLDPERRAQALFHVWLKKYFSGVAFTTRALAGGTEERTFPHCDIAFQEKLGTPKDGDGKDTIRTRPLIHGVFIDHRQDYKTQRSAGVSEEALDQMMQLYVKVPMNLTSMNQPAIEPAWLAREIGGQLAWLLNGSERAALAAQGIEHVRLRNGPTVLPGTVWMIRLLVVSFRMRRLTAR